MENICFQCGKNPGMECPGRKPNERTRCESCFELFMSEEELHQARHIINLLQEKLEKRDFAGYNLLLSISKQGHIFDIRNITNV